MESLTSLLRSRPPTLKSLLADLGCGEEVICNVSEEEVEEMMAQPDKGFRAEMGKIVILYHFISDP